MKIRYAQQGKSVSTNRQPAKRSILKKRGIKRISLNRYAITGLTVYTKEEAVYANILNQPNLLQIYLELKVSQHLNWNKHKILHPCLKKRNKVHNNP